MQLNSTCSWFNYLQVSNLFNTSKLSILLGTKDKNGEHLHEEACLHETNILMENDPQYNKL